jgi:hypothetical protein
LRQLFLETPNLVLELVLGNLRLPEVGLIGVFGLLQLLGIDRQVGF